MAPTPPSNIRNIGIMAHIDAGKTTLSERILFYTQKIHRLGEVHDGAATMDYLPEEQERGITITSACTTCNWKGKSINLIDTPGHVDFTMEVERCLRVLDGAVGVFCAVGGVEPQSETVWRQSEQFKVPKLAFINKLDRDGANFEAVLSEMKERLGANPVAITIPVGQGPEFSGIIDLIHNEKLDFDQNDEGKTVIRKPLTTEESQLANTWREKMLEDLANTDDEFMEKWLEEAWDEADLKPAIQRATSARLITPVYCGAALRNSGVQPLLDAICDYLPSPVEMPPILATRPNGTVESIKPDIKAPPVGLVFKVQMDGNRKNAYLRLYSGTISEGITLLNNRTGKIDRVGRLSRMHADRREQISDLGAGDIGVAVGLRDAQTGDTYTLKNNPVILEKIQSFAPVITITLEPLNANEGDILDEALARYSEEDPTLKVNMDADSGLRQISGMGELHLDVVLERLQREYKIKPRPGQPQVVMRESITRSAAGKAIFDRELGKERHHGEVEIEVEPLPRGTGIQITDYLPDSEQEARKVLPLQFIQAAREGVENALATGVNSGWPVTDCKVHIAGIGRTEGLTTVPGTSMAASQALREALLAAGPQILEPVMRVEMTTPEEFLGNLINLFNQRSGHIENINDHAGAKVISGLAPMRQLFGFSTSLRSASQGRAGFSVAFERFDTV